MVTMNNLNISKFQLIELKDRELFARKLSILNRQSCECSFNNLFFWSDVYDERFVEFEERLIVASFNEKSMMFPIGEYFEPEELATITRELREQSQFDGSVYDAPRDYVNKFATVLPSFFKIETSLDYDDYIHTTESLTKLSGKKLNKKRNLISQFRSEYPNAKSVPTTVEDIPAIHKFASKLNEAAEGGTTTLNDEFKAQQKAINHLDAPNTEGLLLLSDKEEIIAFSIFGPINDDTFDIHFEKASREFKGAAQVINQATAELLFQRGITYINREQDLGIAGLRQAKNSYKPEYMLKRYRLKLLT